MSGGRRTGSQRKCCGWIMGADGFDGDKANLDDGFCHDLGLHFHDGADEGLWPSVGDKKFYRHPVFAVGCVIERSLRRRRFEYFG